MSGFTGWEVAALVVAALFVGFAKTAIGGVIGISVALFAAVLPARESTGALLPLLLVGDLVAVGVYRQHADWAGLLRLFPSVAVGVLVGVVFIGNVGDTLMRRTIGVLLLLLVALHLWQRRRRRSRADDHEPEIARASRRGRQRLTAPLFGIMAGFTTMVANAAGPVMSIYLLSAGLGMLGFLGTMAWFFLIVNASKVPFSAGLGLISAESLMLDVLLVPAVLAGALLGRILIRRLQPARFEWLVLVFTALSSLNLVR